MTDISDAPVLPPEPDIPPKPDPIAFTPVADAAELPDEVKNGEIPEAPQGAPA